MLSLDDRTGKEHGCSSRCGDAQDAALNGSGLGSESPEEIQSDSLLGGEGLEASGMLAVGSGLEERQKGLLTVLRLDEGRLERAGRRGVAGWFLMW